MKKIKYFAIIAASIFTLTSCTDIVEVDDLKAKENKPSTGAPTVDKVTVRRYIRHTICFSHLFPVHFLKK